MMFFCHVHVVQAVDRSFRSLAAKLSHPPETPGLGLGLGVVGGGCPVKPGRLYLASRHAAQHGAPSWKWKATLW